MSRKITSPRTTTTLVVHPVILAFNAFSKEPSQPSSIERLRSLMEKQCIGKFGDTNPQETCTTRPAHMVVHQNNVSTLIVGSDNCCVVYSGELFNSREPPTTSNHPKYASSSSVSALANRHDEAFLVIADPKVSVALVEDCGTVPAHEDSALSVAERLNRCSNQMSGMAVQDKDLYFIIDPDEECLRSPGASSLSEEIKGEDGRGGDLCFYIS
ncbi:hypothetical protein GQ44DRAFT_806751 [Phaeosphaeriaceae sp. PMI808]|nr:hypothetical protein GQ44DRAFT_806751 [Phaeosphaeriaceae sp. PMI808]